MTTIIPYNYLHAAFSGKSLNASGNSSDQSNHIRSLSGKLIFNDDQKSAEEMKIKIFIKDFFNVNHYLGSTKTDKEGKFNFKYSWKKGWLDGSQHLTLGIVEDYLPFAQQGFHFKKEAILQKIERKVPFNKKINDIGIIALNFADISHDIEKIQIPTANHMQPPSYFWKLFQAILPEILKEAIITLLNHWLKTEHVQMIYDSFGPSYQKRPSSPTNLIEELLNHISAVDPEITDTQVVWTANWDGLEFDKNKSLPNVKIIAHKDSSEHLHLDSITIKFREDVEETIIKGDDKRIHWAIYLARSVFTLKGEAELHLAEGHILPGIISKVFFKHIKPGNPLFSPLEPHLSQLDFINWFGSRGLIFGTGSILDTSALNDKSITEVILKGIKKKSDWVNYTPPKPLSPEHYHAKAENLHFNLLWVFFDRYIQRNKEDIIKHWSSIYNWSEGLQKLIETLPGITNSEDIPSELDLKRLAKFLAWLVTKTTFLHWAAHSRQQLLTDIRQCSLAIEERGLNKKGELHPFGNTLPSNGAAQLFLSRVLMNFEGDSIFKDPNGDMNKELLALLRKNITNYHGYDDIIDMHLTTQI